MVVEIDEQSGFCFGVHNAVKIAEEALNRSEKVYSLGPIVHNDMEMERLSALGLVSVTYEEFSKLKNCKVLIRAHGEPPETYRIAEHNKITIIEATCPIVKKLQSRIRETHSKSCKSKGQIVIFGKSGHAEVIGLLGHTDGEGILVSEPDDLKKIDMTRPVFLFSQTTMSIKDYNSIADLIRFNMRECGAADPEKLLRVHNTICGQVSNREPHLKAFAKEHDVIIFVSGRESSNGKMLYEVCKSVNSHTYFVSSTDEIDSRWFEGKRSAGVCGATSTPKWLIEKIRDIIREI
ncbi:MAG: 4-hydroxy-3-methylbut-2-enyl diphosphate reductase [Bacteroidia bacterium]|nr:4-hydroxy-3-methylbut-2-enyl diphosphate reductase [Bacteroidia bacterium]